MDDKTRYAIIAQSGSALANLFPTLEDEVIGHLVAEVAIKLATEGGDAAFTAENIVMTIGESVEHEEIAEGTIHLLRLQVEEDVEIDLDTEIASLGLDADAIEVLTDGLAELFGVEMADIDFAAATTVGDVVEQIQAVEFGDEGGECPCGNPDCGGGGPARSAQQDEMIDQAGVTFAPVLAGEGGPGFIYTVGLSEKDMVDLIFVGDCSPHTIGYLGVFVEMQMQGDKLAFGLMAADDARNGFGVPIFVTAADEKLETHAYGTVSRLDRVGSNKMARLAQVVMPDNAGRFPWETGYDWIDQSVERPNGVGTA